MVLDTVIDEVQAEDELEAVDRLLRSPSRRFLQESLGPRSRNPLEIDEEPSEERELGRPQPLANADDAGKNYIS